MRCEVGGAPHVPADVQRIGTVPIAIKRNWS